MDGHGQVATLECGLLTSCALQLPLPTHETAAASLPQATGTVVLHAAAGKSTQTEAVRT